MTNGSSRWRGRTSRRTAKVAVSVVIVAGAIGGLTLASGALFTNVRSVTGNTFSTGTVIVNASPATSAFNISGLGPGHEVTAEVVAANTGSAPFRYAVTSETTEDVLAAELVLSVRSNVTDCTAANWDATGVQIYQGPLGDTSTPGGLPILGDATSGSDPGDRVLNATASETLCLHVELSPASTSQNTTTTATFNFSAEQTTNN